MQAFFCPALRLQYGNNRFAQRRHVIRRHTGDVYTSGRHRVDSELFTQTQYLLFGQAAEREHPVLLNDEREIAAGAFFLQVLTNSRRIRWMR